MARASGWPITIDRLRYGGASSRSVTIPASTPGLVATATRTFDTETFTGSSGTGATLGPAAAAVSLVGSLPAVPPRRPGQDESSHLLRPGSPEDPRHLPQGAAFGQDVVENQHPGARTWLGIGNDERPAQWPGRDVLSIRPGAALHRRRLGALGDRTDGGIPKRRDEWAQPGRDLTHGSQSLRASGPV